MTFSTDLRRKRTWEDWLGLALGIAIALGPWILDEAASGRIIANAALAGLAVMLLAELDLVSSRRWVEVLQLAIGAWVAIAAVAFGYSGAGALKGWHAAAGLAVMALAAFELWQGRES